MFSLPWWTKVPLKTLAKTSLPSHKFFLVGILAIKKSEICHFCVIMYAMFNMFMAPEVFRPLSICSMASEARPLGIKGSVKRLVWGVCGLQTFELESLENEVFICILKQAKREVAFTVCLSKYKYGEGITWCYDLSLVMWKESRIFLGPCLSYRAFFMFLFLSVFIIVYVIFSEGTLWEEHSLLCPTHSLCLFICLFFWDRAILCSCGCPRTRSEDHATLKNS